jgi:hypothetical protein
MSQPTAVWRDLVALGRWEVAKELLLPLPWLIGSLVLAVFTRSRYRFPLSFS